MVTSFDISFVDPVTGLSLSADRTNKVVDVVDTTTNSGLVQLASNFAGATPNNDNAGSDGVIIVNHHEVWAGDGTSQVTIIDLSSQKPTHVNMTGGAKCADELCFDPHDQLALVANDAETPFPFVSIISTKNYSILARITMDRSSPRLAVAIVDDHGRGDRPVRVVTPEQDLLVRADRHSLRPGAVSDRDARDTFDLKGFRRDDHDGTGLVHHSDAVCASRCLPVCPKGRLSHGDEDAKRRS